MPGMQPRAGDRDLAAVVAVDAEDGPDHLAAAGTDQTGQRHDLTGPDLEADVAEHAVAGSDRARRAEPRRGRSPAWGRARTPRGRPCGARPGRRSRRRSGRCETHAPSRITVIRWHRAKTSSNRCEMNSTAAPASRSDRATLNSRSTSTPDSAAVGSSMTSTRASNDSALAISTSCWSAMDSPRAGRSGSSRTPSRANRSTARRRICRVVSDPAAGCAAAGGP